DEVRAEALAIGHRLGIVTRLFERIHDAVRQRADEFLRLAHGIVAAQLLQAAAQRALALHHRLLLDVGGIQLKIRHIYYWWGGDSRCRDWDTSRPGHRRRSARRRGGHRAFHPRIAFTTSNQEG